MTMKRRIKSALNALRSSNRLPSTSCCYCCCRRLFRSRASKFVRNLVVGGLIPTSSSWCVELYERSTFLSHGFVVVCGRLKPPSEVSAGAVRGGKTPNALKHVTVSALMTWSQSTTRCTFSNNQATYNLRSRSKDGAKSLLLSKHLQNPAYVFGWVWCKNEQDIWVNQSLQLENIAR